MRIFLTNHSKSCLERQDNQALTQVVKKVGYILAGIGCVRAPRGGAGGMLPQENF